MRALSPVLVVCRWAWEDLRGIERVADPVMDRCLTFLVILENFLMGS